MTTTPCRDCGYPLEPGMRGCPQCARNVEAESMIDRVVLRIIVAGVIVIAMVATAALIYLRRQ